MEESDSESETRYVQGDSYKAHEDTWDARDDLMAGIRPLFSTPGFAYNA